MTPDQAFFALSHGRPTAISAAEWPEVRARLVEKADAMDAIGAERNALWVERIRAEVVRRDTEFAA